MGLLSVSFSSGEFTFVNLQLVFKGLFPWSCSVIYKSLKGDFLLESLANGSFESSLTRNSYVVADSTKFFLDSYSRKDLDAGVEKGGSPLCVTVGGKQLLGFTIFYRCGLMGWVSKLQRGISQELRGSDLQRCDLGTLCIEDAHLVYDDLALKGFRTIDEDIGHHVFAMWPLRTFLANCSVMYAFQDFFEDFGSLNHVIDGCLSDSSKLWTFIKVLVSKETAQCNGSLVPERGNCYLSDISNTKVEVGGAMFELFLVGEQRIAIDGRMLVRMITRTVLGRYVEAGKELTGLAYCVFAMSKLNLLKFGFLNVVSDLHEVLEVNTSLEGIVYQFGWLVDTGENLIGRKSGLHRDCCWVHERKTDSGSFWVVIQVYWRMECRCENKVGRLDIASVASLWGGTTLPKEYTRRVIVYAFILLGFMRWEDQSKGTDVAALPEVGFAGNEKEFHVMSYSRSAGGRSNWSSWKELVLKILVVGKKAIKGVVQDADSMSFLIVFCGDLLSTWRSTGWAWVVFAVKDAGPYLGLLCVF